MTIPAIRGESKMAPGERFELPRDCSQWLSRPPQYRTMRPWLQGGPDMLGLNVHGNYFSTALQ